MQTWGPVLFFVVACVFVWPGSLSLDPRKVALILSFPFSRTSHIQASVSKDEHPPSFISFLNFSDNKYTSLVVKAHFLIKTFSLFISQ